MVASSIKQHEAISKNFAISYPLFGRNTYMQFSKKYFTGNKCVCFFSCLYFCMDKQKKKGCQGEDWKVQVHDP